MSSKSVKARSLRLWLCHLLVLVLLLLQAGCNLRNKPTTDVEGLGGYIAAYIESAGSLQFTNGGAEVTGVAGTFASKDGGPVDAWAIFARVPVQLLVDAQASTNPIDLKNYPEAAVVGQKKINSNGSIDIDLDLNPQLSTSHLFLVFLAAAPNITVFSVTDANFQVIAAMKDIHSPLATKPLYLRSIQRNLLNSSWDQKSIAGLTNTYKVELDALGNGFLSTWGAGLAVMKRQLLGVGWEAVGTSIQPANHSVVDDTVDLEVFYDGKSSTTFVANPNNNSFLNKVFVSNYEPDTNAWSLPTFIANAENPKVIDLDTKTELLVYNENGSFRSRQRTLDGGSWSSSASNIANPDYPKRLALLNTTFGHATILLEHSAGAQFLVNHYDQLSQTWGGGVTFDFGATAEDSIGAVDRKGNAIVARENSGLLPGFKTITGRLYKETTGWASSDTPLFDNAKELKAVSVGEDQILLSAITPNGVSVRSTKNAVVQAAQQIFSGMATSVTLAGNRAGDVLVVVINNDKHYYVVFDAKSSTWSSPALFATGTPDNAQSRAIALGPLSHGAFVFSEAASDHGFTLY